MAKLRNKLTRACCLSTQRWRRCVESFCVGVVVTGSSHDLEHFVHAQDPVYSRVVAELRQGRKQSHWMWFIFPQIAGLGSSPMAQKFALGGLDDATRYLAHPILGPRLIECAGLVLATRARSAMEIFGGVDAVKLRSSATLFAEVSPPGSVFHRVLDRFFNGEPDAATLDLLRKNGHP